MLNVSVSRTITSGNNMHDLKHKYVCTVQHTYLCYKSCILLPECCTHTLVFKSCLLLLDDGAHDKHVACTGEFNKSLLCWTTVHVLQSCAA